MKTKIEKLAGKMAEKFATSLHEDNDLGILTRHPNIRFSYLEGFNAALNIGRLEGRVQLFAAILKQGFNGDTQDWIRSRAIFESDELEKLTGGAGEGEG